MLKLYRPDGSGCTGQHVDSWEQTWQDVALDRAVRWVGISHLRPVFDRYFPRQGKILEGGCGAGQFVIHYHRKGYDIEGVDFAPKAIERLKTYDPTLQVRVGDVTRLPYDDRSMDCYYSGGVVEHFEEGPWTALAEARRVLRPEGRLLITVPFVNWIRSAQARCGIRNRWWDFGPVMLMPRRQFLRESSPVPGYQFAEYVFGAGEFARLLKQAGFTIETIHACDLEWGEMCRFVAQRLRRVSGPPELGHRPLTDSPEAAPRQSRLRALWKELFVTEAPRHLLLRPLVRSLARISGHMVLFVCRPAPQRAA